MRSIPLSLLSKPALSLAAAASLPLLAACQQDKPYYEGPYARQVNAAVPAIERSIGLKFKTPPRVETRSKDEVRSFLEKKFDEDQPALELAGAEQAYRLFGLLPDTLNLRKFMLTLLAEQVVGYYDPATKVLYVVGATGAKDGPVPEMVGVTINHELVHALQDQYLGLDSLVKARGDNDRQSAMQAVVEGQATFEQLAMTMGGGNFAARLPGGWDRVRQMIRDSQGSMPVFATAPLIIQETLLFPYLSGAEFARQVKEKGRTAAQLYGHLPASTAEVLNPARYLDSTIVPVRVTLPAPKGVTVTRDNNLGEFETRLLLMQHLNDVGAATRGAAGLVGDRYYVVNTPRGAGITWATIWSTAVGAAQFRDLMERIIEKRFEVKSGSGGNGSSRRFSGKGRRLELAAATVDGRPAVLYTDVPDGASTDVIDVKRVKVAREK